MRMYRAILEEAKELYEELVLWRRTLHEMPELGLELPNTASFVAQKLEEFGIPFETKVNGSCVVGYMGQGERCLLLRADMDALPVREEADLSFAAQNGNMHACGHDMHAAALLGAAKILKRHERELKGRVKLLFQPGEETFSGAKAVLAEGILENPKVDFAFAVHVASICPVGVLAYGTVPNASVYGFKITLTGKGTHGAMPQNGIDPIQAGVHIYQGLQELIARECEPDKETTLTIGQFQAGSVGNVIPETAVLQGTLRTFDEKTRVYLIERIREVTEGIGAAFRVKTEIEELTNIPMVCCEDRRNRKFARLFQSMSEELKVVSGFHTTASEDFALYAQEVPSSYFVVGAQAEGEKIYAHHNPKVCFNEKALPIAAAAYAGVALEWE